MSEKPIWQPAGLNVSGFFNYSIVLNYFNWQKYFNEDTNLKKDIERNYEVFDAPTDVLNVTHENVDSISKLITDKIVTLNTALYQEVTRDTADKTYHPTCRLLFSDIDSTCDTEWKAIGRLRKDFFINIPIYNHIKKDSVPTIDTESLTRTVKELIIDRLLNVIEELKEEESFTPPDSFLKKFMDKL